MGWEGREGPPHCPLGSTVPTPGPLTSPLCLSCPLPVARFLLKKTINHGGPTVPASDRQPCSSLTAPRSPQSAVVPSHPVPRLEGTKSEGRHGPQGAATSRLCRLSPQAALQALSWPLCGSPGTWWPRGSARGGCPARWRVSRPCPLPGSRTGWPWPTAAVPGWCRRLPASGRHGLPSHKYHRVAQNRSWQARAQLASK